MRVSSLLSLKDTEPSKTREFNQESILLSVMNGGPQFLNAHSLSQLVFLFLTR